MLGVFRPLLLSLLFAPRISSNPRIMHTRPKHQLSLTHTHTYTHTLPLSTLSTHRPRNKNAVFVSNDKIFDLLKRDETVIVTQVGDSELPRAFPDSQVLRPHVVRAGTTKTGVPVTMTYCGLTHLGMAFETPPHKDGKDMELAPLTQLENNLVLVDRASGHIFGQQINGVDETRLLDTIAGTSQNVTKRRPTQEQLKVCHLLETELPKEVASWRMTLDNFVRTYPKGEVFINDYKMYKGIRKPITSLYDVFIDAIFETTVHLQATQKEPIFPTIQHVDDRLPPKELVWAFNVGNDYVAVTERFVRGSSPNGVHNLLVGGMPIVAAWDSVACSLGIWHRPSTDLIKDIVDIRGRVNGQKEPLERLSTVKNGAFWMVWANFFPQTRVNPEA